MPFPINQESLFAAGYEYSRWEKCAACELNVEIWTTPGKREIVMDPMPGMRSAVVRHYETCKPSPDAKREPVDPSAPRQIKMYGVTDKNMMAVGWFDGTLEVAFKFGRYRYANVPEDIFVKLRNPKQPYPNSLFTKLVKNHPELYPFTKLS